MIVTKRRLRREVEAARKEGFDDGRHRAERQFGWEFVNGPELDEIVIGEVERALEKALRGTEQTIRALQHQSKNILRELEQARYSRTL